MLGRVLLQQGLEVGRASRQDHLVGFARLTVTCQSNIGERLLLAKVLEGRDHVGLEVIPSEAELLLVTLSHLDQVEEQFALTNLKLKK